MKRAILLMLLLSLAGRAHASFHLWRISEVYSDPSGSVQFIELQQPGVFLDDEQFLAGQAISSGSSNFTFPANLPGATSGTSRFLIGTPGYAALAGVPAPDYTLPANNFFSTSGDTLTFSFVDTLAFTSAQLSADGTHSLVRTSYGGSTYSIEAATPTNFAGTTGAVPEPGSVLGMAGTALCLLLRRLRPKRGRSSDVVS